MSMSCPQAILRENVAESDGIAKALDAGNAVLPFDAGGAAKQIGGAWCGDKVLTLEAFRRSPAEPERARGKQGYANDVAEHQPVLVPADTRAGRVFRDEHLLKFCRRDPGKLSGAGAKAHEKLRHIISSGQAAAVEIIAPAE